MERAETSYTRDKRTFVKIEDGESIKVKLLGSERIQDPFDSEETTMKYMVEDLVTSKKLEWTNGTFRVAEAMLEIEFGTNIQITRTGEGKQTRYKIEPLQ